MSKQILVNFSHYETRVATLENGEIRSLHIEREEDKNVVGNIYLGVVKRVLPGMQAAFLELGLERTAFLYVDDIIDQPFGGDVDLLEEDTESEGETDSSVELGAEDDGEPLKESYDEEVEEEGGRQKWERDVTEVSAKGPVTVETKTTEASPEVTEESEEFFEKSPEERAEELVAKGEVDQDDEDDLFESEDSDEGDDQDDEEDSDLDADQEEDLDDEDDFESEEPAEGVTEMKGNEPAGQNVEEAPVNAKIETPNDLSKKEVTNPEEGSQTQEQGQNLAHDEAENDNVGNRVERPRENRQDRRPRGRSWGRQDSRRPSHRRDSNRNDSNRNDRGRDSYESRDRQGRDRDNRDNRDYNRDNRDYNRDNRDYNRDDSYRAPRNRDEQPREGRSEYRSENYQDRDSTRDRSRSYDRDYDRESRGQDQDYDRDQDRSRGSRDRNVRERSDRDRDRDRSDRDRNTVDRYDRDRNDRDRSDRDRSDRDRTDRDRSDRDRNDRDRNDRDRSDRDRGDRPRTRQSRGPGRNHRDRNEGGRRSPRRPHHHGGRSRNTRRFQKKRARGSANIQDLLKEGQEILVQVAKAPIGTKGARLTTHISLPGRNLVLMPTVKHLGISRRIESERERRRLRDIFTKRLRPKDAGFIIRTVAEGKSFRDLKADAEYLLKTWARIKRDSKKKRAPALIHEDLSLSMRSVRDFFTEEVDSFVIDNAEEHENVLQFIEQFMPQLKSTVKLFKGPSQLFEHYGIEAEISRALNKKVWLKSGGYLLFDQSEALTAIDVNTGRYVGSKSLEETILKTNLEAVKEIAYQLRIRNVGGIIILDLIDMESMENREKVYQALQEALSEDKSRTNILKISELGLVEMTRKRTHEDLIRYLTEACSICEGRGYHKSRRTVCFEIFREIEKEAISNTKNIVVFAAPAVVTRMMNEEKKHVAMLEERFGKKIAVKPDPAFHIEQYEVFGKH
jgi:ribonuclease G